MIKIRKIDVGNRIEKTKCLALLYQAYPFLTTGELLEKFFWGEERAFVILIDKKIIGLIIWEDYEYLPDKALIIDLAAIVIDKEYRRQGNGEKLFLESLRAITTTEKVVGIHVLTTPDAIEFFRKVIPYGRRTETPPIMFGRETFISILFFI